MGSLDREGFSFAFHISMWNGQGYNSEGLGKQRGKPSHAGEEGRRWHLNKKEVNE